MTFTFRNDQTDVFLEILREVSQWLVDGNQIMWEPHTLTPDNLIDDYTRGNCYVTSAHDETGQSEPAATFILQWADPLYYADVPPGTAAFIHKVAIRRRFSGQNLFQLMLDFCRQQCIDRNIREIQLETDATRPVLMRFYERYGFEPTYQKTITEFGQTFLCQYYVLRF